MPKSRPDTRKYVQANWTANFNAALKKSGLTQRDVTRELDLSQGTVGNWSQGRSLPSLENVLEVAALLDERASFLMGDRVSGRSSLEALGRRLAVRLGQNRLSALTHMPDRLIHEAIDRAIGEHLAAEGAIPAAPAPVLRSKTPRSKKK